MKYKLLICALLFLSSGCVSHVLMKTVDDKNIGLSEEIETLVVKKINTYQMI